ncbi:hypothetical protein CHUAL_001153 [Chamberlinius hualienensis]
MVQCCVPFCKSTSVSKNNRTSFHKFPFKNREICDKWIKVISRSDNNGGLWNPDEDSVVCGIHFVEKDFSISTKRKNLLAGAIPSNFPGYPSYKIPTKTNPRSPIKRRGEFGGPVKISKNSLTKVISPVKKTKKSRLQLATPVTELTPTTEPESSSIQLDPESSISQLNIETVSSLNQPTIETNLPNSTPDETCSKQIKAVLSKLPQQRPPISKSRSIRNPLNTIRQLKRKIRQLTKINQGLQLRIDNEIDEKLLDDFKKVVAESSNGNLAALFILEQVKALRSQSHRWSETIIRHCVLWRGAYTTGYEFARKNKLLLLPSRTALKRFTEPKPEKVGMKTLVRKRFVLKSSQIQNQEKHDSCISDEVIIHPMQISISDFNKL